MAIVLRAGSMRSQELLGARVHPLVLSQAFSKALDPEVRDAGAVGGGLAG